MEKEEEASQEPIKENVSIYLQDNVKGELMKN